MNKKRSSIKKSHKFQAVAALAAAAFLSACATKPAPCIEPPSPPASQNPATPADTTQQPAPQDTVKTVVPENKAVENPAEQNKPAEQNVPEGTPCTCPVQADSTAKASDTSKSEDSKQDSSKQEISRTDSSKVEQPVIVPVDTTAKIPPQDTTTIPVVIPAPADSLADTTASATPDTIQTAVKQEPALPPDPYQEFPALANSVFLYADSLYKQGKVDSAVTYLQRFRVIKPLWTMWEDTADSLLQVYGKTNEELAKQYEPLVLQIKNMNRVQTAYSIVAETADSLISLAPGDSLTRFANEQKQIAYDNTLKRAQKEMVNIRTMAEQRAQFAEAEQRALEFQMRHRDFEKDLEIQALIDYIRELAQAAGSEASKYWDKHDPAKAMEEAIAFIEAKKFSQAKELLTKLKASNLRKEAMEKYVELADAYCNTLRKETSQLFAKAQKQKNEDKKKELLQNAIKSLDKCIAEYPESSLIQKVQDNRKFLEKELEK